MTGKFSIAEVLVGTWICAEYADVLLLKFVLSYDCLKGFVSRCAKGDWSTNADL